MRQQQSASATQTGSSLTEGMRTVSLDSKKRLVSAQAKSTPYKPPETTPKSSRGYRDKPTGELSAKNIKCFNCNEKGHFASSCQTSKVH